MIEKNVSESINQRRSVRIYDSSKQIDLSIVKKCIKLSTLSPNSSNLQLWEFYHIISKEVLDKIRKACFNQSAALTSKQLVIFVVRKDLWRIRVNSNIEFIKKNNSKSAKSALDYYEKIIPKLYTGLNPIKGFIHSLLMKLRGCFKTTFREVSSTDLRIVAHKSTALAAQNFMTSMSSQDYDTCPMEGFDSNEIKKILKLPRKAEISMIISCGTRKKDGVYGDRFRVPFDSVYHKL
jgi:nitroreductase